MSDTSSPAGFGRHLTLDGYGGDVKMLSDMESIRATLDQLPDIVEMTKIAPPYLVRYDGGEKPEDWGYSGFILIAESHISIHTFPKKGFITIDVYTCKDFNPEPAIAYLVKRFGIKDHDIETHQRGLRFERT